MAGNIFAYACLHLGNQSPRDVRLLYLDFVVLGGLALR